VFFAGLLVSASADTTLVVIIAAPKTPVLMNLPAARILLLFSVLITMKKASDAEKKGRANKFATTNQGESERL